MGDEGQRKPDRLPDNIVRTLRACFYFFTQVDSINSLLKGSVMAKACEETKHFYSDHSQPGTSSPNLCVLQRRVDVSSCYC